MNRLAIDAYVVDALMHDLVGHDKKASAFLVYLLLHVRAGGRRGVPLSLRKLAAGTGLSKRAVQLALAHLSRRGLLEVRRSGPTSVPDYLTLSPWSRR